MNVFTKLLNKYLDWRDTRFLKKQGYINWKQYFHDMDPDINKRTSTTKDFYGNYNYVYVIKEYAANDIVDMQDWCENNCVGKWRMDSHRVLPNNYFTQPNEVDDTHNYIFNDIGGWDFMFFAFMDDTDYVWFVTRWA